MGSANLPRTKWINDLGDRVSGTPLNDQELQKIYDAIESRVVSGNFVDVAVNSIVDNYMAGLPFIFGGSPDVGVTDVAYPAGATLDVLAPNTGPLLLPMWLVGAGKYRVEAVLVSNNVAYTTTLGLFNLTDTPNVPIVEISSTSVTGALVPSGDIVFATSAATKTYGVKLKTDNAAGVAKAYRVRFYRAS
jgi:hypothetical protein